MQSPLSNSYKIFNTRHTLNVNEDMKNRCVSLYCKISVMMNTYDSKHAIMHGAMHYIDFCLTELFALLFYSHCCWL